MRSEVWLTSWAYLLLLLFVIGTLSGAPWLVAFAVAVATVIAAAVAWRRHALDHLTYRRRWHYRRGFPGEKLEVRIEVDNRKLLPISWLRVSDPWPLAVAPIDRSNLGPSHIPDTGMLMNLYSLRWFEHINRNFTLLLKQRGVYPVGPALLESGDMFGFFDQRLEQPDQDYVTVFPEVDAFPSLMVRTNGPFGDRRARRHLFEDPNLPMGIRPYQPEDDFRRIHWPATARTGELQVKVYQPVSSQVMVVCLNAVTTAAPWMGTTHDLFEQMVRISASLVYRSMQDGYAVGLLSNGCLAHADRPFRILPGRSPNHLPSLLQALAAVTTITVTSFETYLIRSMPQIPYGAALVIVTALVTPELSDTLLRLKRYRSNITLISLEPTPPPALPGIQMIHLPYHEEEAAQ